MKSQGIDLSSLTGRMEQELRVRHPSFDRDLFASGKDTRDYLIDPEQTSDTDFLPLLALWHRHKLEANEEFQTLPELLAIGQYDDLTHFILELIQNGDDNDYSPDSPPCSA